MSCRGLDGWLFHLWSSCGEDKFRLGLGAFGNFRDTQGGPPGGLWISGVWSSREWGLESQEAMSTEEEFCAEEKKG